MNTERLINSWNDYTEAVSALLPVAHRSIDIFDHDLASLELGTRASTETLSSFLQLPGATLRIALQSLAPVLHYSPRLIDLARLFPHRFQLVEVPPHLASLGDSLFLVDGESGVIRFQHDQARSKEILGDETACRPYCMRFQEIWNAGGTPCPLHALGL